MRKYTQMLLQALQVTDVRTRSWISLIPHDDPKSSVLLSKIPQRSLADCDDEMRWEQPGHRKLSLPLGISEKTPIPIFPRWRNWGFECASFITSNSAGTSDRMGQATKSSESCCGDCSMCSSHERTNDGIPKTRFQLEGFGVNQSTLKVFRADSIRSLHFSM